jgi:hypothetical protein
MTGELYVVEVLSISGQPVVLEVFDRPAAANFRICQLQQARLNFAAWDMWRDGPEPNRVRPVFLG